jgi:hypothetical protein
MWQTWVPERSSLTIASISKTHVAGQPGQDHFSPISIGLGYLIAPVLSKEKGLFFLSQK